MIKDTIFSPCREYRYTLYREWMPGDKVVQFIGLNPSTALAWAKERNQPDTDQYLIKGIQS